METVKTLSAKVEDLQEKINLILKKLEGIKTEGTKAKEDENWEGIASFKYRKLYDEKDHIFKEEDIIKMTKEITDEYGNVYVCLPPLYINLNDDERIINLSFSPSAFEDSIKLKPQMISKYKNSLINGQCRSIPGVAPDFNGISYLTAKKLIKSVGGEMMNWKTQLYIQLIYLAMFRKSQDAVERFSSEYYSWDEEKGCSFSDTGKGEGEFLGIEQLFTSGYTFISFDGLHFDFINDMYCLEYYYEIINQTIGSMDFIEIAEMDKRDEDRPDFGLWGLLGRVELIGDCPRDEYKAVLSVKDGHYYRSHSDILSDYSPRLCKAPQKEGE